MSRTHARLATAVDALDAATTLALGFAQDPVWGAWAFPDPTDRVARLVEYWAPFVNAGLKYDGVWLTPGVGAVAVWVPPGQPDMDADDEAAAVSAVERLCGDRVPRMLQAFDLFESNHQTLGEPHWYLSLLATHPDHRGQGLGMALVAAPLDLVDQTHLPAYLESTNDANLARYGRAGFVERARFDLPEGPTVTTMWRTAR
jgi:GNAT superfamily N-acetyltransferase